LNLKNGDIYLSSSYPDNIVVIHNYTNKVIECIPLKMNTFRVDFNPTDGNTYVTNRINNTIGVIETEKQNKQLYPCSLGSSQ
jgi:DNA-binding beta-propeller fold protein YncE